MVSFRSFPWKGREPVSISNCGRQGSIQALVPISHAPTSFHASHSAPFPGFLLAYWRFTWIKTVSVPPPSVSQNTRSSIRDPELGRGPVPGWGTQVRTSLESFQGRALRLGEGQGQFGSERTEEP